MSKRIEKWLDENYDRKIAYIPGSSYAITYQPKSTYVPLEPTGERVSTSSMRLLELVFGSSAVSIILTLVIAAFV
jgi:hypothetical protein